MPATPQRLVGETVRFFLLLRLPVIGMGVSFQPSSRQAPRPLPDWGGGAGRGWWGQTCFWREGVRLAAAHGWSGDSVP